MNDITDEQIDAETRRIFGKSMFLPSYRKFARAVLALRGAPAAPAAEPRKPLTDEQVERLIEAARKVVFYRMSMSYNDAYFGEAPGLFKSRIADLERALPAVPVIAAPATGQEGANVEEQQG